MKPIPADYYVKNNILYISPSSTNSSKTATIKIRTAQLTKLEVSGHANVSVRNMPSLISIYAADNANVNISGSIPLRTISVTGSASVHAQWVNAHDLSVFANGHSKINLAGIANIMTTRLSDYAHLSAQYLRTQQAVVQTRDNAIAKVLPVISLNAYAFDNGQIYYYKFPALTINEFTSKTGRILGWEYWS